MTMNEPSDPRQKQNLDETRRLDAAPEIISYNSADHASHVAGPRQIGPYVLERLLGKGGFGEVWLATRQGSLVNTRLAVKLPIASQVNVDAIRREANLWAKIGGHPNIMPIFEATVYDGQVVIVSEYAAEGTLADWMVNGQRANSSTRDVLKIILGVLSGLSHLHKMGVVHRDIKPANVLMQNGHPRLSDFGLSRLIDTSDLSGLPAGTPAYMAPEAFDGVRSVQTDLWSVGILIFEMLTGGLPFPGQDWSAVMTSIITHEPQLLPVISMNGIDKVISRCLDKNPSLRYQSADEVISALEQIFQPANVDAPSVRLLTHIATLPETGQQALFINVANMSTTHDCVITHIWIEDRPKLYIEQPRRPLPKRLKPRRGWQTWIAVKEIPKLLLMANIYELVRLQLSTGAVIHSRQNDYVQHRDEAEDSEYE